MSLPTVTRRKHRLLGAMLRMSLGDGLDYDLTLEEGRTLSRAFTAVAHDWRRTDTIYLSPVGADNEFSARVSESGVAVETPEGLRQLSWDDVTELAERLASV